MSNLEELGKKYKPLFGSETLDKMGATMRKEAKKRMNAAAPEWMPPLPPQPAPAPPAPAPPARPRRRPGQVGPSIYDLTNAELQRELSESLRRRMPRDYIQQLERMLGERGLSGVGLR